MTLAPLVGWEGGLGNLLICNLLSIRYFGEGFSAVFIFGFGGVGIGAGGSKLMVADYSFCPFVYACLCFSGFFFRFR